MQEYQVVFDWSVSKPAEVLLGDTYRNLLQDAYVEVYNMFCESVNPCLPIWNKAYEECKDPKPDYNKFMQERHSEVAKMLEKNSRFTALMPEGCSYLVVDEDMRLHLQIRFQETIVMADLSFHLKVKEIDDRKVTSCLVDQNGSVAAFAEIKEDTNGT